MRRTILFTGVFTFLAIFAFSQTKLTLTLDTKLMESLDYSLGGGSGVPSTANKVYAHLGLCTCNLIGTGSTATRDCSNETANKNYCLDQISPYKSNVWQHVVGNWGENPMDDGVGKMTDKGDGVYSIEFIIEEYFSSSKVNTVSEAVDVVPSQKWDVSKGGKPYTIGMVFRNEDATLVGRDNLGSDLFIIDLLSTPTVVQGSDPNKGFPAISFALDVDEVKYDKYNKVYPNPFTTETNIEYYMPTSSKNMSLKIYNIVGEEIAQLVSGFKEAGTHSLTWNGYSQNGVKLSSGIYYSVLSIENQPIFTEKIVINR